MNEVTPSKFKSHLGPSQQADVDEHLAAGRGVAKYVDGSGAARLVVSYGPRGSDVVGLPPRTYGQSDWEMIEHCPPQKAAAPRRSPLLDAVPIPQITPPPRGQSRTEHPQVLIGGRRNSHPRGGANSEFLDLLPGRKSARPEQIEAVPQPEVALTEEQSWYARHL